MIAAQQGGTCATLREGRERTFIGFLMFTWSDTHVKYVAQLLLPVVDKNFCYVEQLLLLAVRRTTPATADRT